MEKSNYSKGIAIREKTDRRKYHSNEYRSKDTPCGGAINRLPICSTALTDGDK